MKNPNNKHLLIEFQELGDTNSLLDYIQNSGRDKQRYQEVIGLLITVFDSLSFGEQPSYENLDTRALLERKTEAEEIVKWMVDSRKADMKTAALELMGVLGWETFRSNIEQSISSETKWERLTAVKALGPTPLEWATETLKILVDDSDPNICRAARQALEMNIKARRSKSE